MMSMISQVRPNRSFGSMPNVLNSSHCDPTPMPRSNRPLDAMSTAAMSSASRSGLWNGAQMTEVPMRMREVFAATLMASVSGEEFPEAKQKWCSPKYTAS